MRHTEQNEQCFGHPRTVWTDAQAYFPRGSRFPPCRLELAAVHVSTVVDPFRPAGGAVLDRLAPRDVAVTLHHGMRTAQLVGLFRIQGGVAAAVHHPGAALAGTLPEPVADQSVARVEPDADDITLLEPRDVERLEPLVAQHGVSPLGGCGCSEHIHPARSDEARSEGKMAWVYQMYAQVGYILVIMFTISPCGSGYHRNRVLTIKYRIILVGRR